MLIIQKERNFMHLLHKIVQIVQETDDIEIWLSKMAMNTILCESEFLGVAEKYFIIKSLGIEMWIETGEEQEFAECKETSYFRIQTVQDLYQRTGKETKKILL